MLRAGPAASRSSPGDLAIDFERRAVTVRGEPAQLTYVEFELLAALAGAPGRVMTREMLLEQVWGDSAYRDPRTIDVHIRHLREKLEREPRRPEYLFTVAASATGSATRSRPRDAARPPVARFDSVRNRLALLFFVITAAAVGFIYLYVVPQLRSSLTAEKLRRLEQVAADQSGRLGGGDERGPRARELAALVRGDRPAHRRSRDRARPSARAPTGPSRVRDRRLRARARAPLAPELPGRRRGARPAAADRERRRAASAASGDGRDRGASLVRQDEAAPGWVAVLSTPARRRRGQRRADPPPDPDRRRDRAARRAGAGLARRRRARAAPARGSRRRPSRSPTATSRTRSRSTPSDEVGQLASTFNEMQRRLAVLDSARREFIANASHELRTPIFSLGGFVELLDEDEPGPRGAGGVRADDARAGRPAHEAHRRPARPLQARRRRDPDAARAGRPRRRRAPGRRRVRADGRAPRHRHRDRQRPRPAPRSPTRTGSRRSCVSSSTTRSLTRRREPRSR